MCFLLLYISSKQPRGPSSFPCCSSIGKEKISCLEHTSCSQFPCRSTGAAASVPDERDEPATDQHQIGDNLRGVIDEVEVHMEEANVKIVDVNVRRTETQRYRSSRSFQLPRHLKEFDINAPIRACPIAPSDHCSSRCHRSLSPCA